MNSCISIKTLAFLIQQQLLNCVLRAMVTLLGRHCSWKCENTGVIHCGNIFAISVDGTVKTCSSRAGCRCTQLWRQLEKITLTVDPNVQHLNIAKCVSAAEYKLISDDIRSTNEFPELSKPIKPLRALDYNNGYGRVPRNLCKGERDGVTAGEITFDRYPYRSMKCAVKPSSRLGGEPTIHLISSTRHNQNTIFRPTSKAEVQSTHAGVELANKNSKTAFAVLASNLPLSVSKSELEADFKTDYVEREQYTNNAVLYFKTFKAAKEALQWNGASYRNQLVTLKWSKANFMDYCYKKYDVGNK